LEDTLADHLRSAGVNFSYESFRIPYTPKPKNYTPDFLLLDNGIVIESKGYFDSADRAKHLLIQAQYPLIDIRFVFARAQNRIGKKSTTTYSRWASDHGFQWAEGRIPDTWLHEPPNTASLQAIRNLCPSFPKSH
jgi:hypothetical protein